MGLLDLLFGGKKCPLCGTRGARKSDVSDITVRCPNPQCQYFDPALKTRAKSRAAMFRRSDFVPEHPLEIRYRNFQGQENTFTAEKSTIARKRNHILARVIPTGERITLSRDRILNLSEIEIALPQLSRSTTPVPRGRDLQVLSYHKKHATTSPLHEKVRAKYPDW
ncbi:MAG TPA: hypothetical protein VNY29_00905 [Terriglobales bacterium]|jgi:hypothetical protein|nr:hypothetical protein [Terriglobales bacterium]